MSSHGDGPAGGYVPLAEAARRVGRSVRTVQRWVGEGRVGTVPHPTDRRRRLLSMESLNRIARRSPQDLQAARTAHRQVVEADREAILRLAHELDMRTTRAVSVLGEDRGAFGADDRLRHSRFFDQVETLVGLVRGDLSEAPDLIQTLLDDVLEVVYGDPATGGVSVPDAFWRDSLVGRHLARARLMLYPPGALVSLFELVALLGMPRGRAETILERIGAPRIFDPDEQRWLYPREVADAVRAWVSTAASDAPEPTGEPAEAADGESGLPPRPQTPPENKRDFKLVRTAYRRRYFPEARQRRRPPKPKP